MSVGHPQDGSLPGVWVASAPNGRARATLIGAVVAIGVHAAIGAGLSTLDLSELFRRDRTVEIDVNEPPPPPPEVKPAPPPPPPPPAETRPRPVVRHVPVPVHTETPPPSKETPNPQETPPVFGVTMDSVVTGDGPGMAVPVGNTLMTKERGRPKPSQPVQPLAGKGDGLPAPVPEVFISVRPEILREVKAPFPPEAERMGLEGTVTAKLLIDEEGNVRDVKIIKAAGHGFDERAREYLKKYKFSPARTSDGKAVPTSINFNYVFEHEAQ
jgi:protein TonB